MIQQIESIFNNLNEVIKMIKKIIITIIFVVFIANGACERVFNINVVRFLKNCNIRPSSLKGWALSPIYN